MARIGGIELPNQKRLEIALQYIYGVGITRSRLICTQSGISAHLKVRDLSEEQVLKLRDAVKQIKVEGDLRREMAMSIKRLQEIGCYRGLRHKKGLPCRGQRTRTNARTKRGKRQTVANKKKETK